MSVGRSVQYTSPEQVLEAYEEFEIPSWSIRNGNQLLWKYSGDDLSAGSTRLARVLKDIKDAKSIGIYMLCLYEKETDEIRIKTDYDMSFNFRFQSESEFGDRGGSSSLVLEELRSMRREIEELRERVEDNDEGNGPRGPLGSIGELLKNPEVMSLLGQFLGKNQTPPAQISGVTTKENENARSVALEILDSFDPDLTNHLIKLATLAQKNPVKFKTMISILDSL